MKLRFDHNLSPRLVALLADIFAGSSHLSFVGLERVSDQDVWNDALAHGYTIVTKDTDSSEFGLLRGFPPKVIWLRIGNCAQRVRSRHCSARVTKRLLPLMRTRIWTC